MKSGTVLLIGRPNVGKSTFVNNLIGQKVAITSPKPQTTRFPIQAFYEDERGQIIFVDTPGVFDKTKDMLAKKINLQTEHALKETVDVVLYMVDHTRRRDFEEAKVLGMVRKMNKPTLLIVNKTDLQEKTYLPQYEFLKDEFPEMFKISALNIDSKTFLSELIREKIFLKTGEEIPYSASVVIDEVTERENKVAYIKARILTTKNRYKKMLLYFHVQSLHQ